MRSYMWYSLASQSDQQAMKDIAEYYDIRITNLLLNSMKARVLVAALSQPVISPHSIPTFQTLKSATTS